MELRKLELTSTEIYFPIDFMKKSLSITEEFPESSVKWTGNFGVTEMTEEMGKMCVNIETRLQNQYFIVNFDKLYLNIESNKHTCILDDVKVVSKLTEMSNFENNIVLEGHETKQEYNHSNEKTTQTNLTMNHKCFKRATGRPFAHDNKSDIQKQTTLSPPCNGVKRKPGRPRKIYPIEIEPIESTDQLIQPDVHSLEKVKTEVNLKENNSNAPNTPRYSLRGVKLNADMMKELKREVTDDFILAEENNESNDIIIKHEAIIVDGEQIDQLSESINLKDKKINTKDENKRQLNEGKTIDEEQFPQANEAEEEEDSMFEVTNEQTDEETDTDDSGQKKRKPPKKKTKIVKLKDFVQIKKNLNTDENITSSQSIKNSKKTCLIDIDNVSEALSKHKPNSASKRPRLKIDYGNVPTFERRKVKVKEGCVCKICHKKLSDFTGVYKHVKTNHSDEDVNEYLEELAKLKIVRCELCDEEFADKDKLRLHDTREHQTKGSVECIRCGKQYKNMPALRQHVKWVHIKKDLKHGLCHLCPATFRSSTTLKYHIDQIHNGNTGNFTCEICNKKFYNKPQLKRHSRCHGLDESKRIFCKLCNKSFLFAFNLHRHMTAVHSQNSEKFHCSYCGKGFLVKTGMIAHVQLVHFNLLPFMCKECNAPFLRSQTLKEHMINAHGQTDFKLTENVPKNSFYNKTFEDLFYCSYCSKGFTHKAKLIEHMHKGHSDAFPFRCGSCDQGFLERSFLVVHTLKAHGELLPDTDITGTQGDDDGMNGEIHQIISTRAGYPRKIVPISLQTEENVEIGQEMEILSTNESTSVIAPDSSMTLSPPLDGASSNTSSLLVKVASGETTYQYVIETPDSMIHEDGGSITVAQDIANLLLAAEQSIQEGGVVTTDIQGDGSTVQEINLVIDENNQIISTSTVQGSLTEQEVEQQTTMEFVNQGFTSAQSGSQGEVQTQICVMEGQHQENMEVEADYSQHQQILEVVSAESENLTGSQQHYEIVTSEENCIPVHNSQGQQNYNIVTTDNEGNQICSYSQVQENFVVNNETSNTVYYQEEQSNDIANEEIISSETVVSDQNKNNAATEYVSEQINNVPSNVSMGNFTVKYS